MATEDEKVQALRDWMSAHDTYDSELERFVGFVSVNDSNSSNLLTESDVENLARLRKARNKAQAAYLKTIDWRE